VQRRKL